MMEEAPRALHLRYLSQRDVIACGGMDMAATMAAVEEALRLRDAGECVEPHVSLIHWGAPHHRRMTVHPAYVGGEVRALGVKWVGSNPDNPRTRNLPRATGIIALVDPESGQTLCIMDGTVISAMRTGAVVGAAARLLAPANATTVASIGAGVIGRTQLMGLAASLPTLRRVRVFDIDRERAEAFARSMSRDLDLEIVVARDPEEAIRGAQVVAPATNVGTGQGFIRPDWLEEGAFLANVSLNDYLPEVVASCRRIVVDTRAQLEIRGLMLADAVHSGLLDPTDVDELGSLLRGSSGSVRPVGTLTLFSPNGLGIEDVINASRIFESAVDAGVGLKLPLWDEPIWY